MVRDSCSWTRLFKYTQNFTAIVLDSVMKNFLVLSAFFAAVITITAGGHCGLKGADVIEDYHRRISPNMKMECYDVNRVKNRVKRAEGYCTLTSKLSKRGPRRSTPSSEEMRKLVQGLGYEKIKHLQPKSFQCQLLHESQPIFAGNHMNTYTLRCTYKKGNGMSCP
ncbi:hypothetical protein Q1695_016419 [Nippostrongylus brasiliensis]|nr:hypothetical protein Q1695_016419 [Nippostrongylus brasiliensis]